MCINGYIYDNKTLFDFDFLIIKVCNCDKCSKNPKFVSITEIEVGDGSWWNILHNYEKRGGYSVSFHKN